MGIRGFRFSKKWLILGLLCFLVPLFQNMSPLEEDYFDIREKAPRKPAGNWDSPISSYFPKDISGQDLIDIQNSMLSHHFDPLLKDLEFTYLTQDEESSEFSQPDGILSSTEGREKRQKWQVGLINPTRLRLSYENLAEGKEFKLTCEAQTGERGVAVKMFRPLTSKLNLGVSHETQLRQSQIQMDYTW